jgi:glc operon protein GlcG
MPPKRFLVASLLALTASGALAQSRPAVVERATLSDAGARLVLDAALDEARKREVRVSIAVVDADGNLLAFERIGNAFPATITNAVDKANTAAQTGKPSGAMQDRVDGGRVSYLALQGLTPLRGGMPIIVSGQVVGGVASSGAAAEVDELIAASGAAALARDGQDSDR